MTDKEKQLPQCENSRRAKDGSKRRCQRGGYACWVSGSFGRLAKVLCGPCITSVEAKGWVVRYQLEGDNPAQRKEA